MARYSGQRGAGYWSGAQKSHRSSGPTTRGRSMENQNRSTLSRRVGFNPIDKFEGNRKNNHLTKQHTQTTLERGRSPASNLLRNIFACVGLDWARPSSSSTDRIDQIAAVAAATCTDRSTSRWTQNQRATGRGSASKNTQTLNNIP